MEASIALLRRIFPPNAPQLALELGKLARLRFNHCADAAAARALAAAASSLARCFGDDHDEVKELVMLMRGCKKH